MSQTLDIYIYECIEFLCDVWNLCTYHFWDFGEKTPSLLFMLRKEKSPFIAKLLRDTVVNTFLVSLNLPKIYFVPQYTFIHQVIAEDFLRAQSLLLMWYYDTKMMWCYDATNVNRKHFAIVRLCIPLGTTLESLSSAFP